MYGDSTIVTDDLVYEDSVFVLNNVIANGKRTEIEPTRINLSSVASIEAVRTNWLLTVAIWGPIVAAAVVVVYWIFFEGPGGGLEGTP